tara:strand:+ start:268 stop:624 length:357 start_codon:yes stop_codon:yes gene_type:complete
MEELAIKKNSPEASLGLLVSVALVDNHYSNEENIIIYKLCDSYDYPQDKLEALINKILELDKSVFERCEYFINLIDEQDLREKLIEDLSSLISSDHIVHENEIYIYKLIAKKWGMYQS